jgi:pimeloyl-ACP methyl ester carboxylesterase
MSERDASARYTDGYFTVRDGLRLHYRDYPGSADRPPLLCLPALTRNVRDYAELAERYSPRFRVLALDTRGRGLSDYDPQPLRYIPPTYAFDVVEMLDHLGISEAVFVGTSLGGLVTMAMTAIAARRVAAAVLNDVGPEIGTVGVDRIISYVGTDPRFQSWDEAARSVAASIGQAFPSHTHDDWLRVARRTCRERDGEVRFDYDPAIAVPFSAGDSAPAIDMWPLFLGLAQKPLLCIRGEISELLTAETFERMMAAAPDATFVTVPGVGHPPELSEPEAAAAIEEFLGRFD